MKILIFVFAIVLILAILGIAYLKYLMANTPDKNDLESSVDAEVAKYLKRDISPGIVVGIYKNGASLIKGYGTVNKNTSHPPDAETVFQIGSITKVFTAKLLKILCDEGAVSMDAKLGELLTPSIPLSPAVQSVTLKQLATHSSGFPRVPQSLIDKATALAGDKDMMLDPYSYFEPEHIFNYLSEPEGKVKEGQFDYSNYGMGLLAHVLEMVTGLDYEFLLKEKVFMPLGMHDTAIKLTPEMQSKLAQGYTAKGLPTPIWKFAALGGAGAISSNAKDMMIFIHACLAEKGMISTIFKEMSMPQIAGKVGVGWLQPSFIERFVGNKSMVWHNGMVGGYSSYLAIDKEADAGVIVMTNQANVTDLLGMMLMRQIRTQSFSKQL